MATRNPWELDLELGALIASTPVLINELERLVLNDWLALPRGAKKRMRGILERIRARQAGQAAPSRRREDRTIVSPAPDETKPTVPETVDPVSETSPVAAETITPEAA